MQVYNARKTDASLTTEYISVMQMMEDKASIVARFSMGRGESPVNLLSKGYQIQEPKRCCDTLNPHASSSVLCKFSMIGD